MVRAAADRRDPRPHRLVVVARSHEDLLFRDELGYLRDELDLEVTEVLRRPHPGWEGHTGEIDIALLTTVLGTGSCAARSTTSSAGRPGSCTTPSRRSRRSASPPSGSTPNSSTWPDPPSPATVLPDGRHPPTAVPVA